MTQEDFKEYVIRQINESLNEKTGLNEGIDDAAFYIAETFWQQANKKYKSGYEHGYEDSIVAFNEKKK